ncbi:glycosyltransferase family 4 protein [Morganella morganii]|uniref:glycosyltransferase family 4 protein n=1 Tax=Morganella morganii TaxID=582 RepID=UPI001BDA1645|nr:glycosyltransferase family 4 protein [Morganella morganii]MBT0386013.1 glycosyltransferase family 4 protein [Morganella morganii subsp. morganii]
MKNNTVIFFGELPPQIVNGVSISNELIIKKLMSRFTIYKVTEITPNGKNKMLNIFSLIKKVYSLSKRVRPKYFYMSLPTSILGLLKLYIACLSVHINSKKTVNILHIHRGDFNKKYTNSIIYKFLFNLTNKFNNKYIALSDNHKNELSEIIAYEKIYRLANTIIESDFHKKQYNEEIKFVFLSNYIRDKGIIILLEAFKYITTHYNMHKKITLDCYGAFIDHDIKEEILSYNNKYNITINKSIYTREKERILEHADVILLPSNNEGQPLILIEAMYYKCYIISSAVGFIPEMLPPNYPALLATPSVETLIDAINDYLLMSNDDISSITNSLHERYKNTFSNTIHTNSLMEIFN